MTFSRIVIWCQREKKKSCGMGLVKTGFRDWWEQTEPDLGGWQDGSTP